MTGIGGNALCRFMLRCLISSCVCNVLYTSIWHVKQLHVIGAKNITNQSEVSEEVHLNADVRFVTVFKNSAKLYISSITPRIFQKQTEWPTVSCLSFLESPYISGGPQNIGSMYISSFVFSRNSLRILWISVIL